MYSESESQMLIFHKMMKFRNKKYETISETPIDNELGRKRKWNFEVWDSGKRRQAWNYENTKYSDNPSVSSDKVKPINRE